MAGSNTEEGKPETAISHAENLEEGRSNDKEGAMPEAAQHSGQENEDSAKQGDISVADSLEESVVMKDLDTGRAINVLKVRPTDVGSIFLASMLSQFIVHRL